VTDRFLWVRLKATSPIPINAEFVCEEGELLVLIGPSGCGKSTILRSIAGLYSPRSGHIKCMGEDWYDTERNINIPPFRRHVGMVFQNYALFPHMTVQKNIMSSMHGMTNAEKRNKSLSLLSRMKLDGLQDRMPRQLSGGQRQRTAVARALAREPKVLLLDEPFSAVDKVIRYQLYNELKELHQSYPIPIILVTHDFEEARLMGNKIVVLDKGETLQDGLPLHVFNRPRSLAVARLLGAENLFSARVVRHEPEHGLSILDWGGTRIAATLNKSFAPESNVFWHIPPGDVAVHPLGCHFSNTMRNALQSTVIRAHACPPVIRMSVRVGDNPSNVLRVDTAHPTFRNDHPGPGVKVPLSLPFESVHLMAYSDDQNIV